MYIGEKNKEPKHIKKNKKLIIKCQSPWRARFFQNLVIFMQPALCLTYTPHTLAVIPHNKVAICERNLSFRADQKENRKEAPDLV